MSTLHIIFHNLLLSIGTSIHSLLAEVSEQILFFFCFFFVIEEIKVWFMVNNMIQEVSRAIKAQIACTLVNLRPLNPEHRTQPNRVSGTEIVFHKCQNIHWTLCNAVSYLLVCTC